MATRTRLIPLFISLLLLTACATTGPAEQEESKQARAARIYVQLGAGYLQRGNYERALQKLKRALEYDNELPSAHAVIALLYGEMGEDERAEKHFRRALALSPDNGEWHNNYGTFLCRRGRIQPALEHFEAAWSNPRYRTPEVAYANAGSCVRRIQDDARAEGFFHKALQYRPGYPQALMNLAALMFKQGEYPRARGYLQRYEASARHTPGTLWLGMQIERHLNNGAQVEQYREQLLTQFPDSAEARLAEKGVEHE